MITSLIYISTAFVGIAVLVLLYFNLDRIVNIFDHSSKRDRWWVKPIYENPVYLRKGYNNRWPGWDGWYALFVPEWKVEANAKPFNIIRVSIMTGLYGVNGIDNYGRLKAASLKRSDAGEYLGMVQTEPMAYLDQKYINKNSEIKLVNDVLDVRVRNSSLVTGKWPHYQVSVEKDEISLAVNLKYTAHNVAWWANIKSVFSYWAAFSNVEGTVRFEGKRYDLKGFGSFEHGWNRFFFQFNGIVQFAHLFSKMFRVRLVYYHYEILSIQNKFGAGTMLAGGPFGMNIRKRCETFFPNNESHAFDDTKINYLEYKHILNPESNKEFNAPKKWEVFSSNEDGEFKYVAEASSPPSFIAANMIYFDFKCSGYYKSVDKESVPFEATGYGEYVFM